MLEWIAFTASSAVNLYAGFAAFDYASGHGIDNCLNARESQAVNKRGVVAGTMARWCAFTGLPNERRLGVHLSGESGDFAFVYYESRNNLDAPVLHWIGDQNLNADPGEVTWLTLKSVILAR